MPTPIPGSTSTSNAASYLDALAEAEPHILRIPTEQLEPIRLDVTAAVTVALGAAPEVARYRPALVAIFGEADCAAVDHLPVAAAAAEQAHARWLAVDGEVALETSYRGLVETRTRLETEAQSLIYRQVLPATALDHLVGGQSYAGITSDSLLLVNLFRTSWDTVSASTPLTRAELDAADTQVHAFQTACGARAQSTNGSTPASELRQRAFTHFFRTYEEVRRMVGYLRWHEGDADDIAPSLYAGRTRRPKREETLAAPATPGAPTPTSSPVTPVRPGLPGANPFISQ